MAQVEISEAAADPRALILRAEAGEDVRLVEGGEERARFVASRTLPRALPRWRPLRGETQLPADVDAPLPDDLFDRHGASVHLDNRRRR